MRLRRGTHCTPDNQINQRSISTSLELQPGEKTLFTGDVTLLKSKLSVSQTTAIVTDRRLFVAEGQRIINKADVATAREEKQGLGTKIVFGLRDGSSIVLAATNRAQFKAAALILTGQADTDSLPKQPPLNKVKSGTAWLAAFSPLLAGFVVLVVGILIWGPLEHWRVSHVIGALLMRLSFVWLFLKIDQLGLQQQGYLVHQMGLVSPSALPLYLFSRAKVFGKGKAPAIIFALLLAGDVLTVLGSLA